MLRAIARLALIEAARHGQCHARFRGFDVYAVCDSTEREGGASEVSFVVAHRAMLIERGVIPLQPLQQWQALN